jgi:predicted metal-dependent phosphoesterase TrpH
MSRSAHGELGTWPSVDAVVQAIIDALGRAAEAAPERKEKKRLREAAEVVAGIGRDVLTQVLATKIGSAT